MHVELIQSTPAPIETIAEIASICYDSDPKNPVKLVEHLYKNGHHSVFEHIYFTFKIEGISRACSHQLVRHRHCSFTQRSQRYCSEDGFGVVEPETIAKVDEKHGYFNFMDEVEKHYDELQALGEKRLFNSFKEISLFFSFSTYALTISHAASPLFAGVLLSCLPL